LLSSSLLYHATPLSPIFPLSLDDALPISLHVQQPIGDPVGYRLGIGRVVVRQNDVRGPLVGYADERVPLAAGRAERAEPGNAAIDRKSTRLNSSHVSISYAVFCLKKKKQ